MFSLEKYLYRKRLTKKAFAILCGISQPTARLVGKMPVSRKVAEKVAGIVGCSETSLMNPKGIRE